jgi:23S rRNA (adenine2503-C2)-methyltransferase
MSVMDSQSDKLQRPELLGKDLAELTAVVEQGGFPSYRAKQLYHWLYRKSALSFDEMHNLAREFRSWLAENYVVGHNDLNEMRRAADGSVKILFGLADGRLVESVLMPEREWKTLCVSSQVGCAVACTFCMTGFGGFQRQMTAGEIVSQVLLAKRLVNADELPRNLVFMGMGEPMLNLDNVLPALRLLTDPEGIGIAARRITVSTSGILPGIEQLGDAALGVNIAISLNATSNEFRNEIMPINRKYPIEKLLDACRRFPIPTRRRITFEYVLLGGLNDSLKNARELAGLLRGMQCKINLIPWNPDPHLNFKRPSEETIRRFQQYLLDQCFTVSVRFSKGVDIGAACGQLAGHRRDDMAKKVTA